MAEEIEWWDFENMDDMAEAVAGDIIFIIQSALDARGQAVVAFPGGETPGPIFEKLIESDLRWKDVTIIPTDDRLVAVDSPLSNVAKIARAFIPKGARVLPITSDAEDYRLAGNAANARLADLHWPADLVWLGVGEDGHTASIFEGPDLEDAIEAPKEMRATGVAPDPMPEDAPVNRVTLTAAAIAQARTTLIVASGAQKKKVLEDATQDGDAATPIAKVLAKVTVPVDIYWLDN